MREIQIKNDLNIKVYFNGIPNYNLMPNDLRKLIVCALEEEISSIKKKQIMNKNNS